MLIDDLPAGEFAAIVADPPWQFLARAPPNQNSTSRRDVEVHYPTMGKAGIAGLPVQRLAHSDGAHLFLWCTGPCLPQALDVMAAWGFRYSGIGFCWVKMRRGLEFAHEPALLEHNFHVGLGFTTRKNVELCLLGRRGNARRIGKDVRELIVAPVRQHSRKPDEVYDRVRRYCAGPYLELFGRQSRANWTVWGNEATKFDVKNSS